MEPLVPSLYDARSANPYSRWNNGLIKAVDAVFQMEFGNHVWCNHRPLTSIRFENCRFTDVCQPAVLFGGEDEPLTFEMERVTVSARAGHEDMPVLEAKHFARIALQNVTFENFRNPRAVVYTDGTVKADIPVERAML